MHSAVVGRLLEVISLALVDIHQGVRRHWRVSVLIIAGLRVDLLLLHHQILVWLFMARLLLSAIIPTVLSVRLIGLHDAESCGHPRLSHA